MTSTRQDLHDKSGHLLAALADEMTPQALGFLFAAPFARLWTVLVGTAGLVLALRLFFVAVATAAAWLLVVVSPAQIRGALACSSEVLAGHREPRAFGMMGAAYVLYPSST